jgi:hypothetical protein
MLQVFSWEARVPVSPGKGRQTKIKDKAETGREQNEFKGFFPNSLKETHCCLE